MLLDVRTNKSAPNPPADSGVYEVKFIDQDIRLIIGKAAVIRKRLKDQLIKGEGHPPGERLKKDIPDRSGIHVRWATTEFPAAAEEYLLQQHKALHHGKLPKYVHSI
jgi:excinuclease UvrABC nuclease subunit